MTKQIKLVEKVELDSSANYKTDRPFTVKVTFSDGTVKKMSYKTFSKASKVFTGYWEQTKESEEAL